MIDHDYHLLHILLSKSTFYVLIQDMHQFGIYQDVKGEKTININRFVNKILPIIIDYRRRQNKKFKKTILKKYSDFLKYTDDEAMDLLILLADDNYYSDDSLSYHNEKISIRISKENMELMDSIFEDLVDFGINKSKFVRSLLNQYSDMKLDIREFICFNKEYHLFENAIEKKSMIKYSVNNSIEEAYPIMIHTCPYNSEIYLFTLKKLIENKLELKAIRLCDMNNIKMIDNNFVIEDEEKTLHLINDYVFDLKYYDNEAIVIGD